MIRVTEGLITLARSL